MATTAMLSARQSSGLLAGSSLRENERRGSQPRIPSRFGPNSTHIRDLKAPAPTIPGFQKTSSRRCPKPYRHLRVSCLQQSESSGLRSPSYTASEAIKISRCRFKEELSKKDEDIDLAKSALLIAAEDQAQEVWNFCKKLSAAIKEEREPPVLPSTFASAKRDVNIAIGSDGPLQLRVGGHTVDYWLGFLSAIGREVETRFLHQYGEDAARSPLRLITLVNDILFREFGFNGNIRSGDVRNSYLHLTLQTGRGTATMMSIIYIEVLKRVGLKMVGAPISSEYFLCWPMIEGVQIAFDPNHSGHGYLRNDIEHMFRKMLPYGARIAPPSCLATPSAPASPRSLPTSPRSGPTSPRSGPTSPRGFSTNVEEVLRAETEVENEAVEEVEEMSIRPASNRQIVASVLRTLRNISLAQAVRALREFALQAPLGRASKHFQYSLAPAAMQGVLDKDKMRHAISLSERLLLVTPEDASARRDHALMLYHNKQYGQAKSELEVYMGMDITEGDREAAQTLIERVCLMALEEKLWS
ncbi:hypothetical protein KFL_000510070 [Klebsormidium nitens]|uniref:Protein SirB1 N-terminal domain-containing protein n=1 Tax=Klebsormidium nitens TaxID=105231 RepID=A0A1Y1HUU2_KLENI|nr:hypothetical protein KFL_000510070 [Klebsormidium nitens]|eukprot:GAQ80307.1 hypothetical protein KFL_000510070 [Klebsormidium nitens]